MAKKHPYELALAPEEVASIKEFVKGVVSPHTVKYSQYSWYLRIRVMGYTKTQYEKLADDIKTNIIQHLPERNKRYVNKNICIIVALEPKFIKEHDKTKVPTHELPFYTGKGYWITDDTTYRISIG